MNVQPDKSTFKKLRQRFERVPVVGSKRLSDLDPALFFEKFFKEAVPSFLFESGQGPEETARYSFMGRSTEQIIQVDQNNLRLINNGQSMASTFSPDNCFNQMDFESNAPELGYMTHFWGGWVGYMGYELSKRLTHQPKGLTNDLALPDLYFIKVDRLFVYDHKAQILKYIISQKSSLPSDKEYQNILRDLSEVWDAVEKIVSGLEAPPRAEIHSRKSSKPFDIKTNISREKYIHMVEKAKSYIAAGDIYQANLAQRFETNFNHTPFNLYLKLRKVNPSPFSGFLNFKEFAIVSSSPERLVKLEGERIETRPIAGTRPRGESQREDQHLATQLLINEKEKAEHLMLVDLERNDLGRICQTGSVKVTDFMLLEKYSHVIHIVSNIVGKLKPESSLLDIVKAVFPGGTITGCPKIRCMEIIDELEPGTRGPYSGSFGYIGYSKYMDLNIIIRTVLIKSSKAYFHVGAGIVADSIPEKEYQETLHKAAAMLEALSQ